MKTLTLPSPFERERRSDTRLLHDKFSCPCIRDTMATYRISRSLFRLSPWAGGEDKGEGLCQDRSAPTLTLPSPFGRERRSDIRLLRDKFSRQANRGRPRCRRPYIWDTAARVPPNGGMA